MKNQVTKAVDDRRGMQGWRQFLAQKGSMLASYDKAKVLSSGKRVSVTHGNIAEAEFRRWLQEFLPKRFGVTSGYIISQGMWEDEPLRHFDVIIYDQLNSPVLWVEGNPDHSHHGQVRAIPAEHVCVVIEVKSKLTQRTARDAITKLRELQPLLESVDDPNNPYPCYLPENFISYVVFFELLRRDADKNILQVLIPQPPLRGFSGGLVLRGESLLAGSTGKISWWTSQTKLAPLGEKSLLKGFSNSAGIEYAPNSYVALRLMWAEPNFAEFGFELVTVMSKKHPGRGRIASFHGFSHYNPNASK